MEFEHALVVGGTGMLEKASRYLSDHASRLTLVSRNGEGARTRLGLPRVNYISADWTMTTTFLDKVKPVFDLCPVDLILLWMHRSGYDARLSMLDMARGSNCRIIDVHGSGVGDALAKVEQRRFDAGQAGCRYNAVLLGTVKDGGESSRWLTHDEISAGVIKAIEAKNDVMVGYV
ncbi:hypothetical protein [Paraburkholderia sp. Cpub6]|uniref:hypothetical protein n=1 Tax=unclassified Paraburkholderia TaxID=2615204 RepID=UPI00160EC4BF|nr:hypothetical protein [Paraburkholderia sp. Cpub6]MBB5462849.1 hypothetical protein [Paraburkholderia sp. Cpub6]